MRLFADVFSRVYVGMGWTGDARFCVSTFRDAMLIGGMMCLWNVSCHRYSAKSVSLMSPFLVSVSWNAKAARSVSNGLLPVEALAGLFAKHLTVTVQISNDEMYQVVGQCC